MDGGNEPWMNEGKRISTADVRGRDLRRGHGALGGRWRMTQPSHKKAPQKLDTEMVRSRGRDSQGVHGRLYPKSTPNAESS